MLHTKFHRNRTNGSLKQDFLSIYTIYGHGSHLGHVTSIMLINFSFPCTKNSIQNLVENGPVVSEKSKFQFLYVNNLGPRSGNDIDLHTHFYYSISCLHLQRATLVLKYPLFSDFPIKEPKLPNMTLT